MDDDPSRPAAAVEAETTLPLIAEEIHVGRRTVTTGRLRVTRSVHSEARTVELPDTIRTAVEVERVAVGRPVERLEPPRVEGDITVIPVYEEIAVVTRQWVLKEELRVRTVRHSEPQAPRHITLRAHRLAVQRDALPRDAPDDAGAPVTPDNHNKSSSSNPSSAGAASMNSTTIVGVFDEIDQAQDAVQRLEAAGVAHDDIRLEGTVDGGDTPTEQREGGTLRSFFAELFGIGAGKDDDDYPGHYAEAVRRGSTVVAVQARDDAQTTVIIDLLEKCGAVDLDERLEQWRGAGYERYDEQRQPYTPEEISAERQRLRSRASETASETDTTLPVVEESLKIGKREVARGRVRVLRRVVETPVEEQVALREERAVVERKRVDRPADPADIDALKDETIEFTETAEEPVVEKTARVVEEVRLGKRVDERKETVRDTVRRTEVEVENATASQQPTQRSGSSGVVLGGAAGADTGRPGGRRSTYEGPERRRSAESGYSGVERRVAME